MSGKQTYWIADGNTGAKALVEGADARDRWVKVHGWTVSDEPSTRDRVWLQHEVSGGRQQFAAGAAAQWAGLGWRPGSPPEPVDTTKDPRLVDQLVVSQKSTGALPAEQQNTTSATAGGTDKEK